MVEEKHCPRCCEPGETIPAARFGPNKATKTGLKGWCRDCSGARHNERYAADPEYRAKIVDRKRQYLKTPIGAAVQALALARCHLWSLRSLDKQAEQRERIVGLEAVVAGIRAERKDEQGTA